MRSGAERGGPSGAVGRPDDRTASARIRDAALEAFARQGFSVSVRTIAASAGVSPALVLHHFGSKEGLRAACDEHVLAVIRENKTQSMTSHGTATVLEQLDRLEEFGPLTLYVVRSLQAGGELARDFVEQMIRDAETYLAAGVEAGVITPSRDPEARARFLTYQSLGGLLLHLALEPEILEDDDLGAAMRTIALRVMAPGIELYTQGLYVDRDMLDAYLMHVPDPPVAG